MQSVLLFLSLLAGLVLGIGLAARKEQKDKTPSWLKGSR